MLTMSPHPHTPGQGNTSAAKAIIFRLAALRGVNRFTFATWPLWYFLGMRGLTILFVTFAALLVMRGQQQPPTPSVVAIRARRVTAAQCP